MDIEFMLQEVDTDGDGKISWNEFREAMSENIPIVIEEDCFKKLSSFKTDPCILQFDLNELESYETMEENFTKSLSNIGDEIEAEDGAE